MYKTYDKISGIKELQRMLAIIYQEKHIVPSGIYDEVTQEAVIEFQKTNGLSQSGTVNKQTYDLIYDEYVKTKILRNTRQSINFPVYVGDYRDEITVINKMLITVMDSLDLYHTVREGKIYTESSKAAQSELSDVFDTEDRGFDELFYSRLKKEYEWLINKA